MALAAPAARAVRVALLPAARVASGGQQGLWAAWAGPEALAARLPVAREASAGRHGAVQAAPAPAAPLAQLELSAALLPPLIPAPE